MIKSQEPQTKTIGSIFMKILTYAFWPFIMLIVAWGFPLFGAIWTLLSLMAFAAFIDKGPIWTHMDLGTQMFIVGFAYLLGLCFARTILTARPQSSNDDDATFFIPLFASIIVMGFILAQIWLLLQSLNG